MAGLAWEQKPALRHPVLVAGFEGWNDAASAASQAGSWLTGRFGATKIASIDPEEHFDFQSVRPTVELVDGVTRGLKWPANEFFAVPVGTRDLVVLRGVEPNLQWSAFCHEVLNVAAETGCEMVVTLGALLADVPHTRPMRVTGATTDPDLMGRLGLQRSRYEGPTGIVGVLHDTARAAGVVSASLWAPVPHYVSTPPNPLAMRALLDRLGQLLGTPFELDALDEEARAWRARVDEVVSQDDDVSTYVGQLEERYDADAESDVPSGETLAAEVEQFLRDQPDDG
jgi:proteasome assembly chaperone (PAC2) family protein